MQAPEILKHIIPRPDGTKGKFFVPDPEMQNYWDGIYHWLKVEGKIKHPLGIHAYPINRYFGQFGYRFHPITLRPHYFHIGIDIDTPIGMEVRAVADGLFQYSGEGSQNGLYMMISHPQIVSKEGYILHSLYMHLNSAAFNFRLYQKLLRSFGLTKMTDTPVASGEFIGLTGDSGNSRGIFPHLHFQLEFRKPGEEDIIVISPTSILNYSHSNNLTKDIVNFEQFVALYYLHENDLANWKHIITQ